MASYTVIAGRIALNGGFFASCFYIVALGTCLIKNLFTRNLYTYMRVMATYTR
jgi:hypothetical protein